MNTPPMLNDEIPNLRELHKTLADASEVMAAFVSVARSGEGPIGSLVAAADKSVDELAEWRSLIKSVCEMVEVGERH
jgi:hypothetical protein